MTPFKTLYGKLPPSLVAYEEHGSSNDLVDAKFNKRDVVLKELKENLERAQEQMKKYHYKGRQTESFELGEWIFFEGTTKEAWLHHQEGHVQVEGKVLWALSSA